MVLVRTRSHGLALEKGKTYIEYLSGWPAGIRGPGTSGSGGLLLNTYVPGLYENPGRFETHLYPVG